MLFLLHIFRFTLKTRFRPLTIFNLARLVFGTFWFVLDFQTNLHFDNEGTTKSFYRTALASAFWDALHWVVTCSLSWMSLRVLYIIVFSTFSDCVVLGQGCWSLSLRAPCVNLLLIGCFWSVFYGPSVFSHSQHRTRSPAGWAGVLDVCTECVVYNKSCKNLAGCRECFLRNKWPRFTRIENSYRVVCVHSITHQLWTARE